MYYRRNPIAVPGALFILAVVVVFFLDRIFRTPEEVALDKEMARSMKNYNDAMENLNDYNRSRIPPEGVPRIASPDRIIYERPTVLNPQGGYIVPPPGVPQNAPDEMQKELQSRMRTQWHEQRTRERMEWQREHPLTPAPIGSNF